MAEFSLICLQDKLIKSISFFLHNYVIIIIVLIYRQDCKICRWYKTWVLEIYTILGRAESLEFLCFEQNSKTNIDFLHHHYFWGGSIFSGPKYLSSLNINYVKLTNLTALSDKDKNLLWGMLCWYRSHHSNKKTSLSILLAGIYLGTGSFFFPQSFAGVCSASFVNILVYCDKW